MIDPDSDLDPAAGGGVLRRAARVLDVLAAAPEPLSIRRVAERAGLSKSAVQRLLTDLVATDLAAQDQVTRRYGLGPRTLALGMAYQRRVDLRRVALPHMLRLCQATGETAGISVGLGDQLLHLEQVESPSRLRALFDIGRPLPLWFGAPARLLLAVRSDEEVHRIASERVTTDLTPVDPPTPDDLVREVRRVRETGVAAAFEETLPGVNTVSVPVWGADGALAGMLSVTAPSARLPSARVEELLPDLQASATAISTDLGWLPSVPGRLAPARDA